MIDHRYFLSLPYLKINYPIMPLWCYPSSGRSMKNTPWTIRNSKIIPLRPGNYNKNSHILLLVVHYIFTIKSISQSQPQANYMIRYTTIYIIIIPTQAAWAYNKRKRERYNNLVQLFLSKSGILLKRNRFYIQKNWLRSVYSPLVRLNTENVAYVKSIIDQYNTIYSTLPSTQL